MKIIVAPDSYKGCLTAREVAGSIGHAIRESCPDAEIITIPLADGGEGTVEILSEALGGKIQTATVTDPLGRKVQAKYAVKGDTAIIEVAEACGMRLLRKEELNPLKASTRGVGELLNAARESGANHLIIGLGGTATCDGGEGMMTVPGIREALKGARIELLSDVDNPFTGKDGAARVFAPQKGASKADINILERRLTQIAQRILKETGRDITALPGAGAAGGLGGALAGWFGATITSGIDRILDLVHFDEQKKGADLIITGEGRSDLQTLHGKVPMGVLRRAGGIPVTLVSGSIENSAELLAAGFSRLIEVTPREMPLLLALQPEVAIANIRSALTSDIHSGWTSHF
jgi:glycerate kinase